MASTQTVRVLTWNLNARTTRVAEQVDFITSTNADVIAFQEVTRNSWQVLEEALGRAGYASISGASLARRRTVLLSRFAVLASRLPLLPCRRFPVPAPEVCVAGAVELPNGGSFLVVSVHIPTSASHRGPDLKIETQEGLLAAVARRRGRIIVAGDLNAPKAEVGAGQTVAFSPRSNVRAHSAELAFHTPGPEFRLYDAFRKANGYEPADISWAWKNRGKTGGYRLDHILATRSMRPVRCWYEHGVREAGLSDHSPLIADFAL